MSPVCLATASRTERLSLRHCSPPSIAQGVLQTLGAEQLTVSGNDLKDSGGEQGPVAQQYPILRTLQFIAEHRRAVIASLLDQDPRQIGF